MRFSSPPRKNIHRIPARDCWRLWMLIGLFGMIVWMMRYLEKPETVERLGAIFQLPESSALLEQELPLSQLEPFVTFSTVAPRSNGSPTPSDGGGGLRGGTKADSFAGEAGIDLSPVRDNTYFRSEEHDAWFGLLGRLKSGVDPATSAIPATYAQLIKQPEVYRGELIQIRGTAMREEVQQAPTNQEGIESYHRLVVRPEGGGVWPLVIYALELPTGFPTGDELRVPVEIDGIFFKNWSYAWDGGLGLAPVVLANRIHWQAPVQPPEQNPVSGRQFVAVVAGALIGATIVVCLIWFNTRPHHRPGRFSAQEK